MSLVAPAATERFALDLPADPAFLVTARIFVSTLARHFEVDDERIEDLKLAVSEASAAGLRSAADHPGEPLRLSGIHDRGRLTFEVSLLGPEGELRREIVPASDTGELAAGLGMELIAALFEGAEAVPLPDGGRVIRFSVAVPS